MKASGGADAWISRSMKRYENPKQVVLGAQVKVYGLDSVESILEE